jgi:predicted AAA+ superfamily ATPase
LREEIQAEALTRNLEGFSRFLFVCASTSSQFLDLSKLSSEAQVPRESAKRYFEILEDTLVVYRCPAFAKGQRQRLVQHPRFFFFDTGVLNALLENFEVSQDRIGFLFENFFYTQLVHSAMALDKPIRISSYRTEHGAEVDFIVELEGKIYAIEVKASSKFVKPNHRGFDSFSRYVKKPHRQILAYTGTMARRIEKLEVLPWPTVFSEIGLGPPELI